MIFARHLLLNAAKKELRYETSLDKSIIFITEFVRKHGIVQQTSDKSIAIHLYKQTSPYKLQIEFYMQNPKVIYTEEEKELGGETLRLLKDEICPFYVSIQKELDQNLHLECFSINSHI